MIDFYNVLCILIVYITFLIGYWIIYILVHYTFKKKVWIHLVDLYFIFKNVSWFRNTLINTRANERAFTYLSIADVKDFQLLEGSWCFVPLSFVSVAAYPSIALEYGISPDVTPFVTVKVIASQWYWVLELEASISPGFIEIEDPDLFYQSPLYELWVDTYGDSDAFYEGLKNLDSQILRRDVQLNLKNEGFFRLLTTDNKILLPVNTPIKLIVTSADVLHSFALPSMGIKIDAIPGRLSEQLTTIDRPGTYWGQCSELCGPYHGFMPVLIEAVSYDVFIKDFVIRLK